MASDIESSRQRIHYPALSITALFVVGLISSGMLRVWQVQNPGSASYATYLYIGLTVVAIVLLQRVGVPLQRLGFATRPNLRHLLLALAGVAALQLFGWLVESLLRDWPGAERDLERFSDVAGSPGALLALLALSWSFAAFGEELAFRIVLMRSLAFALGGTQVAIIVALVVQAGVFGLIHAYQGPWGVAGTFVSGLVFGILVLAARGSIWPAALAHGLNNTIGILELYFG